MKLTINIEISYFMETTSSYTLWKYLYGIIFYGHDFNLNVSVSIKEKLVFYKEKTTFSSKNNHVTLSPI
jgi:hypothetical protein